MASIPWDCAQMAGLGGSFSKKLKHVGQNVWRATLPGAIQYNLIQKPKREKEKSKAKRAEEREELAAAAAAGDLEAAAELAAYDQQVRAFRAVARANSKSAERWFARAAQWREVDEDLFLDARDAKDEVHDVSEEVNNVDGLDALQEFTGASNGAMDKLRAAVAALEKKVQSWV